VWPAWLLVFSLAVLSLLFHSLLRMMLSSSVQLSLAALSSSSLSWLFTGTLGVRVRDAEGDTWDIGADEYVAIGGGLLLAIAAYHLNHNMGLL
jgi:hypothetical protein